MAAHYADREAQRRIEATLARASACHMSDTKWRKLFQALCRLAVGQIRWKYVGDGRVFLANAPPEHAILESCVGDVFPHPYCPYREIDWVEVPAGRTAGVADALADVGTFPLQPNEGGLRVTGYSW